jgi:hypothetical protein
MKSIMTLTLLVLNMGVGFHAIMNGSWFIAAACSIFGVFCFIDLKAGVI